MNQILKLVLLSSGLFALVRCAPVQPLAEQRLYVVSGENTGLFASNALFIVDPVDWKVQRKLTLPGSWIKSVGQDPRGRLWIGFSGSLSSDDRRVMVLTDSGKEIKTLEPCTGPRAGISFAADRAFIACMENGIRGRLAVVSLETLEVESVIDLQAAAEYTVLSSAATEEAVVIVGVTEGPLPGPYAVATIIDPSTLAVRALVNLGPNTDIWSVIPSGKGSAFLLLNVASWSDAEGAPNDVLVLDARAGAVKERLRTRASPLWGAVDGGALYAFHDATWNQPHSDSSRAISRLDLTTHAVQTWPLPDDWRGRDLRIHGGQILLGNDEGVFSFDPGTGALNRQLRIEGASRLVASP